MKQQRKSSKTAVVSFRISNESYDRLNANASLAGISTREWLERAILENETRIIQKKKNTADIQSLIIQVNKIGNNLNQIAHNMNTANLKGVLTRGDCIEAINKLDHMRALLNESLIFSREG